MTVAREELSSAELTRRFKAAGLKLTPQRLAIYRALARQANHPSAEAIYRAVRPSMPSLSLGTVYKTLDSLARAGLVEEVSRLGEMRRYDANLSPHHHLICTSCQRISDVAIPDAQTLVPQAGFEGFEATAVHVQVLGLCEDCRSKAKG
jgi:Fur family transcriptional regulator, peroxide stress response regulator